MALADGVTAAWHLDGSGTLVVVSAGSNNGTSSGTTSETGHVSGNSRGFDGTNDYISVPTGITSNRAAFSISLWANLDTTAAIRGLYTQWEAGSVSVLLRVSSGSLQFFTYTTAQIGGTTQAFSTTGVWTHFVATYDGSTMKTYVNSVLSGTTFSASGSTNNTGALEYIGNDGTNSSDFDGEIDEVNTWNRAITQSEVTELYNSGNGIAYPFGAVGYLNKLFGIVPGKVQGVDNANCNYLIRMIMRKCGSLWIIAGTGKSAKLIF